MIKNIIIIYALFLSLSLSSCIEIGGSSGSSSVSGMQVPDGLK